MARWQGLKERSSDRLGAGQVQLVCAGGAAHWGRHGGWRAAARSTQHQPDGIQGGQQCGSRRGGGCRGQAGACAGVHQTGRGGGPKPGCPPRAAPDRPLPATIASMQGHRGGPQHTPARVGRSQQLVAGGEGLLVSCSLSDGRPHSPITGGDTRVRRGQTGGRKVCGGVGPRETGPFKGAIAPRSPPIPSRSLGRQRASPALRKACTPPIVCHRPCCTLSAMRALAICLLIALAHRAAANYEGEGTACESRCRQGTGAAGLGVGPCCMLLLA